MKMRLSVLTVLSTGLVIACGGTSTPPPSEPAPDQTTETAPENEALAPTKTPGEESTAAATPNQPMHLCDLPIEAPKDVWPRVEAIRALPEAERYKSCGLNLVEVFNRWRPLPVDLLIPIVAKAAKNPESMNEWVTNRLSTKTAAVKTIIAADILRGWAPGKDFSVVQDAIHRWKTTLAKSNIDVDNGETEFKKLFSQLALVPGLLKDIEAVHRLRCELELNPMGFAVACTPIHKAGRKVSISWRQATRDGILEDLQVTDCTGKSCKKLRLGAAKLSEKIGVCLKALDNMENSLIGEMLRVHLILPPFKSLSL
jgi:hypothetical protein